jgi:hypothetical protein
MSSSTSSSEAAGEARAWRGVASTLAVALLVSGLAASVALGPGRDALAAAGGKLLEPRDRLLRDATRPRGDDPLLVFIGDSTLRPPRAYPKRLERRLPGVEVRSLWAPGLGPAEHFLLLSRVIEQRPDVVVLLAHLRMFRAHGPLWQPDLTTLLPPRDIPRALALPFHAHGVGAARLALASLWGAFGSETWLRVFVGGQELARKTPVVRWLTPLRRRIRDELPPAPPEGGEPARLYGDRLYEGHPDVVMLGASVELAARRGARALVLVSPVPVYRFREAGTLHRADFEGRVALLRRVTRQHGGELLDLHALLGKDDFDDPMGHPSASGDRRIALEVLPWLRGALAR